MVGCQTRRLILVTINPVTRLRILIKQLWKVRNFEKFLKILEMAQAAAYTLGTLAQKPLLREFLNEIR